MQSYEIYLQFRLIASASLSAFSHYRPNMTPLVCSHPYARNGSCDGSFFIVFSHYRLPKFAFDLLRVCGLVYLHRLSRYEMYHRNLGNKD